MPTYRDGGISTYNKEIFLSYCLRGIQSGSILDTVPVLVYVRELRVMLVQYMQDNGKLIFSVNRLQGSETHFLHNISSVSQDLSAKPHIELMEYCSRLLLEDLKSS